MSATCSDAFVVHSEAFDQPALRGGRQECQAQLRARFHTGKPRSSATTALTGSERAGVVRSRKQDVGIVRGVAVGHRIVRGEDDASRLGTADHPATKSDAGAHDGE
jgi:CTP:molybdopterin cytidylyltransferase MocA